MKLPNEKRDLVIRLHNQGFSFRNISRTLRISDTTASRIVKKFNATRSTQDRSRPGRPKLITPREERKIGFYIKLGRVNTAKEMVRSIWTQREKKVSLEKPTKLQKKKCYVCALQHVSWTVDDWSNVLFSD